MGVEEHIARLRQQTKQLEKHLVQGTLMLVDLAGSTAYKTAHPQEVWLPRLIAFRKAVEDAIKPLIPTKYLGDGILVFGKDEEIASEEFLRLADRVYKNLKEVNRSYPSEHAINARVVLGFGSVFLLDEIDPQGSAVDKLFRLEKYVPNGCVGMSAEYREHARVKNVRSAGRYRLKGLTKGLHELFLVDNLDAASLKAIEDLQRELALRDFWDLGIRGDGQITVITGYIPPETEGVDTIQLGDKDALVRAVINIAEVGRVRDLKVLTCNEASDADLRENVVCVGGPYYNSVTLQFMQEIRSPFVFDFSDPNNDRTPLECCVTGQVFEAQWAGNRLTQDYGFLGYVTNPYNPDRRVILACGIETSAVSGIVKAFSAENPHLLSLHRAIQDMSPEATELPDFFCMMKIRVEKNGMPRLLSRGEQLKHLVVDWAGSHNGHVQKEPTPD